MPAFSFDWVIAKDVLEHIESAAIGRVVRLLAHKGRSLFCVVPLGANGRYVVPSYDLDITHRIRQPLEWWVALLEKNGFTVAQATHRFPFVKENYARWEKGNGFIVARSGVGHNRTLTPSRPAPRRRPG